MAGGHSVNLSVPENSYHDVIGVLIIQNNNDNNTKLASTFLCQLYSVETRHTCTDVSVCSVDTLKFFFQQMKLLLLYLVKLNFLLKYTHTHA